MGITPIICRYLWEVYIEAILCIKDENLFVKYTVLYVTVGSTIAVYTIDVIVKYIIYTYMNVYI